MENGQIVLVRLTGEEQDVWHKGVVIDARKQWVQLDELDELAPMIADENSIAEWKKYETR